MGYLLAQTLPSPRKVALSSVLSLMLLFSVVFKTGASGKILSSEISLYSFVEPVIAGDRHIHTSGAIPTRGEYRPRLSTNPPLLTGRFPSVQTG